MKKNKLKRILTGVSDYEGKNVRTLKKSTGYWMGYKNGEFYNKYSGDFKTPNQNSEKPGLRDSIMIRGGKLFINSFNK